MRRALGRGGSGQPEAGAAPRERAPAAAAAPESAGSLAAGRLPCLAPALEWRRRRAGARYHGLARRTTPVENSVFPGIVRFPLRNFQR